MAKNGFVQIALKGRDQDISTSRSRTVRLLDNVHVADTKNFLRFSQDLFTGCSAKELCNAYALNDAHRRRIRPS